jgi:hypothetical protein
MALQSLQAFEEIIMYLSVLRYVFKSNSKRKLYDLNKQAEKFFLKVLNATYGWSLEDLNRIQANYPAVDLGDRNSRVCIQVTAENSSGKIKKTVEAFDKKKLDVDYDRLIVLIITEKKNYSSLGELEHDFFDPNKDVWDVDDLLEKIESLSLEQLTILHDLIKADLEPVVNSLAPPDSILRRAEPKLSKPPLNATKYFDHFDLEPEYRERTLKELVDLYKVLTRLPRPSRDFLTGIVQIGGGEYKISVQPTLLEQHFRLSREEVYRKFQILKEFDIADAYEDDGKEEIVVGWGFRNAGEFFSDMKSMFDEDALERLIADGDFSLLDSPDVA